MGAASGALMLFEQNAIGKLLDDSHVGTMVLGGGAFAIGFALAHPQKTIILERGIHLCADVALTGDFAEVGTPSTPLGHELYDKLVAEGLLADGKVECPPLADFMAAFFAEHGGTALTNSPSVDSLSYNSCPNGVVGVPTSAKSVVRATSAQRWMPRSMTMVFCGWANAKPIANAPPPKTAVRPLSSNNALPIAFCSNSINVPLAAPIAMNSRLFIF